MDFNNAQEIEWMNGSQTWIGVYSWEDVQSVALTHLGKTL